MDEEGGDGSRDAEMDDDDESSDEGEDVDETTVMLVGESGLESALQSSCVTSVCQAELGWISFFSQRPRSGSRTSSPLLCIACHPHHFMYVRDFLLYIHLYFILIAYGLCS